MTPLNVSDWEPAGDEQLGTKPKQWLWDDADQLWLWKEATFNRDREGRSYRKGDDWAEVVAGRVGRLLGLPVATVELAHRGGVAGVVSRSVLGEDDELEHGNELLAELGITSEDSHDRAGYTLESVRAVLEDVGPPVGSEDLPAAYDWFAGYLVLDCLVGNTDRHQDNWGVIRSSTARRLSPSFDHASCLGFLLSDERRTMHLTTLDKNQDVSAYARRASSKFASQPTVVELAVDALSTASMEVRRHWTTVAERAPALAPILDELPDDRMSPPAKRFAAALYSENLRLLSQAIRTMRP